MLCPNPRLQRRPDAFYRDKTPSAQLAERVAHGRKHPQREGKSRQAAWGVCIPDTYKLPALRIIHSPGHTVQGLFGKKKIITIIMAGRMGILAQLKASDPNPGAGWGGGDGERGERYLPRMCAACLSLQGGFCFLE